MAFAFEAALPISADIAALARIGLEAMEQPPADLLISITPGIRTLVKAALDNKRTVIIFFLCT